MFIANKERNFQAFAKRHFGISLPADAVFFYSGGVRVGAPGIVKSPIRGEKGYAACDAGFNPTNAFAQNFGHLATKNVVDVDEAKAREFAVGRGLGGLDLGGKSGFVIVRFRGFAVGLGQYDAAQKKVRNLIPEKRRRKIVNSV
ncbi:MAG: hypothetical protein AB1529_03415 [Candidatus Micrarchaeota archaeon]